MPAITVVIPTYAEDAPLARCLESLARQTFRDFETVVVDDSGQSRVPAGAATHVIHNRANLGFGGAVNQGIRHTQSPLVAVLNDDAVVCEHWLERMAAAADAHPEAGMFASRVRLAGDEMDSAGMLLCADGSSKQRGHRRPPEDFAADEEVLLPSGSAAMYRRAALDECGLFDESFFLYCEDTDLGLRMRRAGWNCWYVADAVVDHAYSHTAGRASAKKAYYVERNRWRVVIKNFPVSMWPSAILATIARYWWHLDALIRGRGLAGAYRKQGGSSLLLAPIAIVAFLALIPALPGLLRKRWSAKRSIDHDSFRSMARRFAISPHEVASQ